MRDKLFLSFAKACYKDRFLLLIVFVVALIVLGPFLEGFIGLRFFMELFFSIIFAATIYAASQKRYHIIIAVILLIPTLSISKYIFSEQVVTRQTISAAVVVYLLLALMWTFIYRLIENLYPASFAVAQSKLLDAENIYLYFSLVTITTLGYGDITPIGRQALSLAVLEAVTGQIYLVVVVAWFVGLYVSRKSKQ